MKTGVIHWGFPPRGGGVEAHLITVLPEMLKQGCDVFVLTETMEGQSERSVVSGLKVFRREELSVSKLEKMTDTYKQCRNIFEEFIKANQIEIIQAHNLHMDYFEFSRALTDVCKENNIPCYLVLHNHEFIDRDENVMVSILKDLPWDKLVCISNFIKQKLEETIKEIPEKKWTVILHGIDIEKFSPLASEEKEQIKEEYGFTKRHMILHPARILRWKGIVPAIKAIPEVIKSFPDTLLVLTGRIKPIYKEEEEIKNYNLLVDQTVKDLKLENNIHIGKYHFSDLPRLTAISDVVIYTTIGDEPFGLCPVEAMSCSVPAVITRSGGLVESIIDGETGFIIEKDEEKVPRQLAEKILTILSDPVLTKKMGRAGRERAVKVFDKKRMAKDFIELSQELMKTHTN
jgi:glycosyltransferase involved in cell wall biosynthesis